MMDKLNKIIESGHMYHTTEKQKEVLMFYVAKQDLPDTLRFVTDCHLRNLAIYEKQTTLHNLDKLIELVATYLE